MTDKEQQIAAELYEKLQRSFSKTEDMRHIKTAIEEAYKLGCDAQKVYDAEIIKEVYESRAAQEGESIIGGGIPRNVK